MERVLHGRVGGWRHRCRWWRWWRCFSSHFNKGVAQGLEVLNQDVLALISQFERDQLQHKHQVNELLKASESISSQYLTFDPESPLERMLVLEDRIK